MLFYQLRALYLISKFFLIILIALSCLNSYAQSYFNLIPPIRGGDKDQARIMSAAADSNGFSILGEFPAYINGDSSRYYIQPILARFDYSGKMLFQKNLMTSFPSPMIMERHPLIKKNDSVYYYRTYINLHNNSYLDKAIFEINIKSGDVLRSKEIEFPGDINANAVITGSYFNGKDRLFLGSYYNQSKINIVEIDTLFNFIRSDTIPNIKYTNAPIYLQLNSDSIFEIIGDAHFYKPNGDFVINIFYSKLDINRRILDYKYIVGPSINDWGFYSADNLTCIARNEDNSWTLLLNEFIDLPNGDWYMIPYFLKYSAEFDTLLWHTKFYDGPHEGRPLYTACSSIKCSDQSGNLGVAYVINKDFRNSAYSLVFKVSPLGDSLWMRKYVPLDFDNKIAWYAELNPIIATPFNSYILVGDFGDHTDGRVKPWILHIDADGCLIPGCNEPISNEDIEINKEKAFLVYPNPVSSDKILMLSRVTMTEDSYLIISDLQGKEIKKTKFKPEAGAQYIIEIPSEIPNGEYLLKVLGAKFQHSEKIIIERNR